MELESTRIFVKVVQMSSFTRAATLLNLPKSTVSRTISKLERDSGTKLLLRTTRNLTLTSAGRAFYESCVGAIHTLEEARKSISGQDSMISGVVRITAPEDIGSQVVSRTVATLAQRYSGLSFELNYTDEVVDLIKEGYDLAIRIGKLPISSFKTRKLGEVILILVASPTYLKTVQKKLGKLDTPDDLSKHPCMTYYLTSSHPRWILKSKKETVTVYIQPRIIGNQMSSFVEMAIAGAGIALVPAYLCQNALATGQLERVLPDWTSPGFPISLVSPLSTTTSARLKLVTDELSKAIENALSSSTHKKF